MNEQRLVDVDPKSATSEEDILIIDTINKFLEKDVKPFVKEFESEDKYPQLIADKMAELGLFGATISPEYGGLGLTAVTYSKIVENVSAVWMSVSGIFNSHLIMCAAVERFGTEEMKQYYLPKFASGEIRGGIALTEPDCGTDLQSIKTKAQKEGDDYIINGNKTWITNSVEGSILAVLVKTDANIKPAHKGMSLILVEKKHGFVSRKLKKLGYKTAKILPKKNELFKVSVLSFKNYDLAVQLQKKLALEGFKTTNIEQHDLDNNIIEYNRLVIPENKENEIEEINQVFSNEIENQEKIKDSILPETEKEKINHLKTHQFKQQTRPQTRPD